jgi:hypothetical protein
VLLHLDGEGDGFAIELHRMGIEFPMFLALLVPVLSPGEGRRELRQLRIGNLVLGAEVGEDVRVLFPEVLPLP